MVFFYKCILLSLIASFFLNLSTNCDLFLYTLVSSCEGGVDTVHFEEKLLCEIIM